MYSIKRTGESVVIADWNGKVIYTAGKDAWLVFREGGAGLLSVEKVGDMNDERLLRALAEAVKFAL